MNNLVSKENLVIVRRNEPFTDSLRVAEVFDKRHDKVLRAIENLIGGLPKNGETPKTGILKGEFK